MTYNGNVANWYRSQGYSEAQIQAAAADAQRYLTPAAYASEFVGSAPSTQLSAGATAASGVQGYVPGLPIDQFLYQQQLEQAKSAIYSLGQDKNRRFAQLDQDYNRFVKLSDEDQAINIADTNTAFALAKERALAGYSGRGVYGSGVQAEGQREVSTEQTSTIDAFTRAAARAKQEAKLQTERVKSDIAYQYNKSVAGIKQSLGSNATKVLSAYR